MPQRSIWRGAISFGLIFVPVEMFAASREHQLVLHFLDNRDFAPVGYERINKTTRKPVDWQHIVKGYEYEKGRYVALSEADFKHANVKASETVDISGFTNAADISPMYYQTPYYLAPSKGGEKVYALLAETVRATRKVAVAIFVMRGRQHLCVVMARKLVEEMTAAWKPQQFHDTYREDLMKRIHEKIRKNETHSLAVEATESERPKAQVIDLMEALKNSLKLRNKHGPRAAAKGARSRKRA